jgi:hypothetical protein
MDPDTIKKARHGPGRPSIKNPWQNPQRDIFRSVLAFMDWRTQWLCVERVNKQWKQTCRALGGCEVVDMSGCRFKNAKDVKTVCERHRGARELDLSSARGNGITDVGLAHLATLTKLRRLRLWSRCAPTYVSALTELRDLRLHGSELTTGADLGQLATLRNLRRLELDSVTMAASGLDCLASLPNLIQLDLEHCCVTNADLEYISGLESLQKLTLDVTKVNGASSLRPGSGCRLTDADLACLSGLTGLVECNLHNCDLSSRGLVHLAALRSLCTLGLYTCCKLEHLRPIASLVSLQELLLYECFSLSDAGLAPITSLINLKWLQLTECRSLTDASLACVGRCATVERLELSLHADVVDFARVRLPGVRIWTRCGDYDDEPGFTKTGITSLALLPNLQQLVLSNGDD